VHHLFAELPTESHRDFLRRFIADESTTAERAITAILVYAIEQKRLYDARRYIRYQVDRSVHHKCVVCGSDFIPSNNGQKFCCSSCGARAMGLTPRFDHTENCERVQV
jgi:predicted RNA-binding Zn-ribbon protein involved in translation (DUF1610 family)